MSTPLLQQETNPMNSNNTTSMQDENNNGSSSSSSSPIPLRTYYISPSRLEQFEFRRLLNISCGILGCCSIGATYSVGILSNGMQKVFGLSQDDIGTILSVGFLMAYFAFPAGWIMDVRGPTAVMVIATAMSIFGWGMFGLDFTGLLNAAGGNVAWLSFLCALFFWTPGFFDPATMLTNLYMYPLDRGTIIMIQKTFMSLASTVVSLTYNGFFKVSSPAKNHNNTTNTSSNETGQNNITTPSPNAALGVDSDEGRSMVGYCFTFAGIAAMWGLVAIIGVREAPSLTLKRNARNNLKNSKKDHHTVIQDAARIADEVNHNGNHYNSNNQNTLNTSNPNFNLTSGLSAASLHTIGGRHPSTGSNNNDNQKTNSTLTPPGTSTSEILVPRHEATDEELETGIFLCHAKKMNLNTNNNNEVKFCTEEEWKNEPRIEIALLEEFPMARAVQIAGFGILAANFLFLWTCSLVAIYVELDERTRQGLAVTSNVLVFGFFLMPFVNRYYCPPNYGAKVVIGEEKPSKKKMLMDKKSDDDDQVPTTKTKIAEDKRNLLSSASSSPTNVVRDETENNDADVSSIQQQQQQHVNKEVVLPEPYNCRFIDHIKTWDCWLFWLALAGISSTGGTLVAAAYQLFESLAKHELNSSAATLNIGLMGIGGAFGRIVIGWVDLFFLTPRRYSASMILPIPSFVALLGLILMPLVSPPALWLPFFLVSCGYGMSWAALLLNARQMFSVDVAQNYLFIFSAGLPTVALQRGVIGPWYDRATREQDAAPGKCLGLECVSLPIAVMGAVCFVGILLSWWVHVRWMRRNGFSGVFDKVALSN